MKEAAQKSVSLAGKSKDFKSIHKFSENVEGWLNEISGRLGSDVDDAKKRFFAIKLFERDDKITDQMKNVPDVSDVIKKAETDMDDDAESIITNERYTYISSIIKDCYKKKGKTQSTVSDKIDRVVTNRWLALPIFAVVPYLLYFNGNSRFTCDRLGK